MNVSYRWLNDVAPGMDLTPDEVEAILALRGAPIEGCVDPSAALKDVVIGKVLETRPHPDADRLSVCRVLGPDGEVQVVCGAPNVEVNALYPFAPVGAVLPGDFKIGKRKIRGELSQGMLCSESELGLGANSDGIMRLDDTYAVGSSFVDAMGLNDLCLDVEVTANRGDLLSHVGVARELHPKGQAAIRLPAIPGAPETALTWSRDPRAVSSGGATITIKDDDLCWRYLGIVIRGVTVGPSPEWLASRLRAAGSRPINNVVDATNYVLIELGQPLHAFDLALLKGSEIVVRRAREGEELATLDGAKRPITPDMLQICDAAGPVAIAGVMGGANSEVSHSTQDLLLECALFEPAQVRATRRALNMSTDASYRYERGVDPAGLEAALERSVQIILATAGGHVDGDVMDVCPRAWEGLSVELRPSRVGHLLGVNFSPKQISELLTPLGYGVEESSSDLLTVTVPGYRSYDTIREVDLIEEIARTHGYDAFPEDLLPYRTGTVPDHPLFQLEDDLRRLLSAKGLREAQTPSLGPESHGGVPLLNPMSGQESHLRRDRLGGLLGHLERNLKRGVRDVRLFELGTGFAKGADGTIPVETPRLAAILTGRREPGHWQNSDEPFGLSDLQHLMDVVSDRVYPGARLQVVGGSDAPWLLSGEIWTLTNDAGEVLGAAGLVDPQFLDLPPWAGAVLALEVTLPAEPKARVVPVIVPVPTQPASERDVALLVPSSVSAGSVTDAIHSAKVRLLERVELFDLYEGDDLPLETRSLAYRLRFRVEDRTLTEREVDKAFARILRIVKEATGVEPRG